MYVCMYSTCAYLAKERMRGIVSGINATIEILDVSLVVSIARRRNNCSVIACQLRHITELASTKRQG